MVVEPAPDGRCAVLSLPPEPKDVPMPADVARDLASHLTALCQWYDRDAQADTAPTLAAFGLSVPARNALGLTVRLSESKGQVVADGTRRVFLPFGTARALSTELTTTG